MIKCDSVTGLQGPVRNSVIMRIRRLLSGTLPVYAMHAADAHLGVYSQLLAHTHTGMYSHAHPGIVLAVSHPGDV